MGRLYQQLVQYDKEDYYPYHMPGHKRHLFGEMPDNTMKMDITEIDGFDNLHQPEGILQELQEEAAKLYGAEQSFYLINGSTCGILAAISAALPAGGHLLMVRNSHKSAYHAAYLRNLTLSYLYPHVMEEYDICDAITPKQVRAALDKEPDIGAVFVVSPTYEGRIADIEEIARVVHEKGIPLIVDEAHGAHLGLYETSLQNTGTEKQTGCFHRNSNQLGADLVIHSVHKTLPAMTQTALLHVNGQRIDRERIKRFLHIYQSSSPSYVLMASIDNALTIVREQGKELFTAFRENYLDMMHQLSNCKCLQFLPQDGRQDIGKLVISTKKIDLPGKTIYDILLQKYHLQLEMSAGSYCLAMFTIGDTEEAYKRMCQALYSIDRELAEADFDADQDAVANIRFGSIGKSIPRSSNTKAVAKSTAISLTQALDAEWELIPLKQAVGRYVADFINLYPPGVPLLVPGEILGVQEYHEITMYLEQCLNVQGVSRDASRLVKVIRQKGRE